MKLFKCGYCGCPTNEAGHYVDAQTNSDYSVAQQVTGDCMKEGVRTFEDELRADMDKEMRDDAYGNR